MKPLRAVPLVLAAVALSVAAPVAAAGKPAFKPKIGEYTGTFSTASGTHPVTGQVAKQGGKYLVQVLISTTLTCADGSVQAGGVVIPAEIKGRAFSVTESGTDSRSGGIATYSLSGKFSSETAFAGTAKKEIVAGKLLPEQGACTTGPITFKLHKK